MVALTWACSIDFLDTRSYARRADEGELIAQHDLSASIATVHLEDCRLSFHRQRSTGDAWCLATGPLGTFAMPMIKKSVLAQVLRHRQAAPGALAQRAPERHAKWQRVTIGDDVVLALRARGNALDFEYLFTDGTPFGGGSSGLPTARRAGVIERAQMWLSGRRGTTVVLARRREE
jgi:hypothetical protein